MSPAIVPRCHSGTHLEDKTRTRTHETGAAHAIRGRERGSCHGGASVYFFSGRFSAILTIVLTAKPVKQIPATAGWFR
jgi:hypothetical protein